MKVKIVLLFAVVVAWSSSACLRYPALAAETRHLLLIAGRDSHGPGAHSFAEGMQLFAEKLKDFPGLRVSVAVNDWPVDDALLDDVHAVVIYSDGLGKHPVRHGKRLARLDARVREGMGIGMMHFALDVPPGPQGDAFKHWIGGHYETHYSANPFWTAEFSSFPDHPVSRGLKPFAWRDEWYFNMRFRENMEGVLPILTANPSDETRDGPYVHPRGPYPHIQAQKGRSEALLWVVEREDGGRGFGFTGGHYHAGWEEPMLLRSVLNALVWVAGLEVPEGGVPVQQQVEPRYASIDEAIARGDLADVQRHGALNPASLRQGRNPAMAPVQQAIMRRQSEIAIWLIRQDGISPDLRDGSQRTLLHLAVERDLPAVATALMQAGADAGLLDGTGWTPLHNAAARNHVAVMKAMLDGGANPNALTARGGTPLHEAAASGSREMIEMLLAAGTDPAILANTGVSPRDIAQEHGNAAALLLLPAVAPVQQPKPE
jgi:hypothetical protein